MVYFWDMPSIVSIDNRGLPISVIIPVTMSRVEFFVKEVLPRIRHNSPREIIINDDDDGSARKRNAGFRASSQPYVFFCDDDILLPGGYLSALLATMEKHKTNKAIGYTYTGYAGIVEGKSKHPIPHNFIIPSQDFDPKELMSRSYISTMSLMRREVFPFFDEDLYRLQDWDLYLTMLKSGIHGVVTHGIMFEAYFNDLGISSPRFSINKALDRIRSKHKPK